MAVRAFCSVAERPDTPFATPPLRLAYEPRVSADAQAHLVFHGTSKIDAAATRAGGSELANPSQATTGNSKARATIAKPVG